MTATIAFVAPYGAQNVYHVEKGVDADNRVVGAV